MLRNTKYEIRNTSLLLTRDDFRSQVFARENGRCVICGEADVDVEGQRVVVTVKMAGEQLAATGLAGLLKPDTRTTHLACPEPVEGYSPTQESVRLDALAVDLPYVQLALF